MKCRSTFVRRDLLLRHDRTVHAKDGGVPLHSEVKRRSNAKSKAPAPPTKKSKVVIEPATLEHLDNNDDMEVAAALMTELHNHASAILIREEESMMEERLSMVANPDLPVFDRAPYPSLAHMPWDMPATPTADYSDCEGLSGASSQTSHDAWESNESALTVPYSTDGKYESASPRHGINTRFASPRTSGHHSPYASFAESQTSVPPASAPLDPPEVKSDNERNIILDNIKAADLEKSVLDCFRLPSKSALNRYLSAYFTLFHHHFPFLHPATFKAHTTPPPLLLAVLSIGALYTFEREQSFMLHVSSKQLATNFLGRNQNFSSRNCPLWNTQTSLLNMMFASWSGDATGLEWACSVKSLLANMVAGGKYELQMKIDQRGSGLPSRSEWVEEEGAKRTFFAVYSFFGLLTMTFNHTPAIGNHEVDSLILPCSESLWNLDIADDNVWLDQLINTSSITFRNAQNSLFRAEPPQYSAFGARIMINAIFLEVWQVKRSPDSLVNVVSEYTEKLHVALETWQKSLDICTSETMIVSLTAPQRGPPMLFNAMAMYRTTCARLEVDFASIQEALRYHVPEEVANAMTSRSVSSYIPRSPSMTKVIQLCFECFQIPALMGIRLFAKSSALNQSPEHILFGFDLMLILSLWLHRLEEEADDVPPTVEEAAMLNQIKSLFDEDAVECGSKLSAAVARIWGGMLDEVVVWG